MQIPGDNQASIFMPFFGMMGLTLLVWLYMYYRRLGYLFRHKIPAQSVSTQEKLAQIVPDEINRPADNLRNLFELPVLFYAGCLFLYVTDGVDALYLACAYGFLALRGVHSLIQCTINRVMPRFLAYILASLLLWFMIARMVWQLIAA